MVFSVFCGVGGVGRLSVDLGRRGFDIDAAGCFSHPINRRRMESRMNGLVIIDLFA